MDLISTKPEVRPSTASKKHGSLRFQIFLGICVLICFELAARGWYSIRHNIPFWETSTEGFSRIYNHNHPYLPVVFKKNARLYREDVQTNNVGFRGHDIRMPKPPGWIRIAALGGSTTWGSFVTDAESWPRVVESLLRHDFPEKQIDVVNAGVPGYNSMEDLINLITRVMPLQPDFVLVYQGYNDMKASSRSTKFEPDYSDWRTRDNPHGTAIEILDNYSRLFFGLDLLAHKLVPKPRNTSTKKFEDRGQLLSFKRNLANIVAVARAHDAVPVLCTLNLAQKSKYLYDKSTVEIQPSEFPAMLNAYNDQIRNLAKEQHVILVDAEERLPDNESLYYDIVHYNPEGNRRLARLYVEQIAPLIQQMSSRKKDSGPSQ